MESDPYKQIYFFECESDMAEMLSNFYDTHCKIYEYVEKYLNN